MIRLIKPYAALLLFLSTAGCFMPRHLHSDRELHDLLARRLSRDELETVRIPFASDAAMDQFARDITRGIHSQVRKSLIIVDAMLTKWKLEYDFQTDLTAIEAFGTSRANCLTFTNLFVALSRAVGMKTVYIDVPQLETVYEGDNIIINSGHICAGVYDGGQLYLIDFSPISQKKYRIYHEIDDLEALANFYNNIGYRMAHGSNVDLEQALTYYNLAIHIKPDFTRAINNKGVALSMLGDSESARLQYLRALQIDPEMPEPNWNLSGLYAVFGDYEKALPHLKRAVAGVPDNASYLYRLGWLYLKLGELDRAGKTFKTVIRTNPDFARAYAGLGVILERQGNLPAALMNYETALRLDPELQEAKSQYAGLVRHCILDTL